MKLSQTSWTLNKIILLWPRPRAVEEPHLTINIRHFEQRRYSASIFMIPLLDLIQFRYLGAIPLICVSPNLACLAQVDFEKRQYRQGEVAIAPCRQGLRCQLGIKDYLNSSPLGVYMQVYINNRVWRH